MTFIVSIEMPGTLTDSLPGPLTAMRRTADLLGKKFFDNEQIGMISDGGVKIQGGPVTIANHGQFSQAPFMRIVERGGESRVEVITLLEANIQTVGAAWLQMKDYGKNVLIWPASDGIIRFGEDPGFYLYRLSGLPKQFLSASGTKVKLFEKNVAKNIKDFAADEGFPVGLLLMTEEELDDQLVISNYLEKTGRTIEGIKGFLDSKKELRKSRSGLEGKYGDEIKKARRIFEDAQLALRTKGNFFTSERGDIEKFVEKAVFAALAEEAIILGEGTSVMNMFFIMGDKKTIWDLFIKKLSERDKSGERLNQKNVNVFDNIFAGSARRSDTDMNDPITGTTIEYLGDNGVRLLGINYGGDGAYCNDIANLGVYGKILRDTVYDVRLKYQARMDNTVKIPENVKIYYDGKLLSKDTRNAVFLLKNLKVEAPEEGKYEIHLQKGSAIINSIIRFNKKFTKLDVGEDFILVDCEIAAPIVCIGGGGLAIAVFHTPEDELRGKTYDYGYDTTNGVYTATKYEAVEELELYGDETTTTMVMETAGGEIRNVVGRSSNLDYEAPIGEICMEVTGKENEKEAFDGMQKNHPRLLGVKGLSEDPEVLGKSLYELPHYGGYDFETAKTKVKAGFMRESILRARNGWRERAAEQEVKETKPKPPLHFARRNLLTLGGLAASLLIAISGNYILSVFTAGGSLSFKLGKFLSGFFKGHLKKGAMFRGIWSVAEGMIKEFQKKPVELNEEQQGKMVDALAVVERYDPNMAKSLLSMFTNKRLIVVDNPEWIQEGTAEHDWVFTWVSEFIFGRKTGIQQDALDNLTDKQLAELIFHAFRERKELEAGATQEEAHTRALEAQKDFREKLNIPEEESLEVALNRLVARRRIEKVTRAKGIVAGLSRKIDLYVDKLEGLLTLGLPPVASYLYYSRSTLERRVASLKEKGFSNREITPSLVRLQGYAEVPESSLKYQNAQKALASLQKKNPILYDKLTSRKGEAEQRPVSTVDPKAKAEELRRRFAEGEDVTEAALEMMDEEMKRVVGGPALRHQKEGAKELLEDKGKFLLARTSSGKTYMFGIAIFLRWLKRVANEVVEVSSPNQDKVREDAARVGELLAPFEIRIGLIEKDEGTGEEIGYFYDVNKGELIKGADDNGESVKKVCIEAYAIYGTPEVFEHIELRERHAFSVEDQILMNRPTVLMDDEFDVRNVLNFSNPAILSGPEAKDARERMERLEIARKWLDELDRPLIRWGKKGGTVTRLTAPGCLRLWWILRRGGHNTYSYRTWKESVETLLTAKNNYHKDQKGGYEVVGDDVVILSETGERAPGTQWQGDLHNAVRLKESLPMKPATMVIASTSRKAFVSHPNVILQCGASGTEGIQGFMEEMFGKEVEKLTIYDKDGKKVEPTLDVAGINLYLGKKSKLSGIVKRVKELVNRGIPIILSAKDKSSAEELQALLREIDIEADTYTSSTDKDKVSRIVGNAGTEGKVTIITPRGTRGTDYRIHEDLLKVMLEEERLRKIGMRLISTYFPKFSAFQIQEQGRVARQGDPGSWEGHWDMEGLEGEEYSDLVKEHIVVLRERLRDAKEPITDEKLLSEILGEIRAKIVEQHLYQTREQARLAGILDEEMVLEEGQKSQSIQRWFYSLRGKVLSGELINEFFAREDVSRDFGKRIGAIEKDVSNESSDKRKREVLKVLLFSEVFNLEALGIPEAQVEEMLDGIFEEQDKGITLGEAILNNIKRVLTRYALSIMDDEWSSFQSNFEKLREGFSGLSWQQQSAKYSQYAVQARSGIDGIKHTVDKSTEEMGKVFAAALRPSYDQKTEESTEEKESIIVKAMRLKKPASIVLGLGSLYFLIMKIIFPLFGTKGAMSGVGGKLISGGLTGISPIAAVIIAGAALILILALRPYLKKIQGASDKIQERLIEEYEGVGKEGLAKAFSRHALFQILNVINYITFISASIILLAAISHPVAGGVMFLSLPLISWAPMVGVVGLVSSLVTFIFFKGWIKEAPPQEAQPRKRFIDAFTRGLVSLIVTTAVIHTASSLSSLIVGLSIIGTSIFVSY
ncbi:MAG TPA: hypothetical protein VMW39_05310, partial [bacterium]|nr:hypothetical protein [bacterium]